ncbi:hypothetical protein TNCV_357241 [Trichonephila clavipes]|nr:hypothetical protein TNCV_357241 [Trichonephila clavipes]
MELGLELLTHRQVRDLDHEAVKATFETGTHLDELGEFSRQWHDVYSFGLINSLVYADKPQTLDHLEDNIRRVIADIRPQMLEKVIENWTSRLDNIRASRGSHMPEIIFKM